MAQLERALGDAIAAFNRGAYFEAAEMFETASHAAGNDHDLKALIVAFNRIAWRSICASNAADGRRRST